MIKPYFKVLILLTAYVSFLLGNVCVRNNLVVPSNFCSGKGNRAYIGDFNGDGKDDFVCHNSINGKNVIYYAPRKPFEPLRFEWSIRWCYGVHSRFFVGDFNGDGRSDFLCHLQSNGYKWVAIADRNGKFTKTKWQKGMGWCLHRSGQLLVGDFNGDGRTDMLCHDTRSGYKWISYSRSRNRFFHGTSWQRSFSKCNGRLLTGDFNGDRKTDIICHENRTGRKLISLAGRANNVFRRYHWIGQRGWCVHKGSFLLVGDINGDGRDDLICKDNLAAGNTWYSKNLGRRYFGGTTFRGSFCSLSRRANFHLADVNGDRKMDFLCINKIGFVQVGISGCK